MNTVIQSQDMKAADALTKLIGPLNQTQKKRLAAWRKEAAAEIAENEKRDKKVRLHHDECWVVDALGKAGSTLELESKIKAPAMGSVLLDIYDGIQDAHAKANGVMTLLALANTSDSHVAPSVLYNSAEAVLGELGQIELWLKALDASRHLLQTRLDTGTPING